MPDEHLTEPERIDGYDYGDPEVPRSPVTLDELERLTHAAGLTAEDHRYLAMAADVLTDQAGAMVDAWRGMLGGFPYLAAYGAHPDGTPNPEYAAASHPRFARWVIDACTRPLDQDWLDYQEEIGLRHTRAKKNRTDDADSLDQIPLRYFLAFAGPVIVSTRGFLASKGHADEDVQRMHDARTKSVLLHLTLWSRPYTREGAW